MKKHLINMNELSSKVNINYHNELNKAQLKAVTDAEGAVLVLAGPGSGKTRTLVYRVIYLLNKGVPPENILLVTFTNKASKEMLNRVGATLKYQPKGLWGGTFHHIGNRTLRKYAQELGYTSSFGIMDEQDSKTMLKQCIEESGSKKIYPRFPAANILSRIISLSINSMHSIKDILEVYYPQFEIMEESFEKIAHMYAEHKKKANLMDYDDLLINWLVLLKSCPNVLKFYANKFKYVLVDEFQDTNRLQFEIIMLLSSIHKNILVVADDAQSIYSFRSAEVKNIFDFPNKFDNCKILKLEANYRSTPQILRLANESIKNNSNQFEKKLYSFNKDNGHLPVLVRVNNISQQAAFITQKIRELQNQGIPLNKIAVLFRARYQSAELELELAKQNIAYVIRGGVRFFEQAHIKDIVSYIRVIINHRDEVSWRRILGLQKNIGKSYSDKIWNEISAQENPLKYFLSWCTGTKKLSARVKASCKTLCNIFNEIVDLSYENMPAEIIKIIVKNGYDIYLHLHFDNADERLEDVEQLSNFAYQYHSTEDFLEDITLREDYENEHKTVNEEHTILSTIHQAKGLEWHTVIIVGLSEGMFPHMKSMGSLKELEEERRLFYVAVTRAERYLYMIYPMTKYDYKYGNISQSPSMFIQELPPDCYEEWGVKLNYRDKSFGDLDDELVYDFDAI